MLRYADIVGSSRHHKSPVARPLVDPARTAGGIDGICAFVSCPTAWIELDSMAPIPAPWSPTSRGWFAVWADDSRCARAFLRAVNAAGVDAALLVALEAAEQADRDRLARL